MEDDLTLVLRAAVAEAAGRAEVREAVGGVYQAVQGEVDARRPRCDASGRCCNFEEYGHRLYVTTAELATFMHELGGVTAHRAEGLALSSPSPSATGRHSLPVASDVGRGPGCPFQAERLCTVHPIRPFGCRVFFCDPDAGDWQRDAYERHHARLKQLHDRLAVPYYYVEWRWALAALGLPGAILASVAETF